MKWFFWTVLFKYSGKVFWTSARRTLFVVATLLVLTQWSVWIDARNGLSIGMIPTAIGLITNLYMVLMAFGIAEVLFWSLTGDGIKTLTGQKPREDGKVGWVPYLANTMIVLIIVVGMPPVLWYSGDALYEGMRYGFYKVYQIGYPVLGLCWLIAANEIWRKWRGNPSPKAPTTT